MNAPRTEVGNPSPADNQSNADPEEVGLFHILSLWWRLRVRIFLLAFAGLAVMAVLLAIIYPLRPSQQQFTVVFRMLFKGAEKGLYPNGMPFTPSDIVATPVLEEVYRRNQLEKFTKFEDFKAAFAVINVNPGIDKLRREFADKLEDKKLTPVERQKLETEYDSRMKALQNGEFTLVFQHNGALSSWPDILAGKVIEDILSVWVDQSRTRGVYKFDLSMFSANVLDEVSNNSTSDYTLLLDRLRLTINRILGNLDLLEATPGARLVRVGEKQVSLGEMQAALHDYLTFEMREIASIIYSFGLFREPVFTEAYLKEQLFRLDLQSKEIQARNEGMQQVMVNYSNGRSGTAPTGPAGSSGNQQTAGLMPQLNDGFLDRIITMSGQGSDTLFRQDIARQIIQNEKDMFTIESDRRIYQRSLDALGKGAVVSISAANAKSVVDEKVASLIAKLRASLQNVAMLHSELSSRNLQPSQVYTIVVPLQQERISPLSMRSLSMILGLVWCAYLGGALVFLSRKLLE